MNIKVKAFSEYERYKKERIGKPFKSMGDADWFAAGFLAASSTSSNSDYAKCSNEIFNELFYNHDFSYKDKIEAIIKKHFA